MILCASQTGVSKQLVRRRKTQALSRVYGMQTGLEASPSFHLMSAQYKSHRSRECFQRLIQHWLPQTLYKLFTVLWTIPPSPPCRVFRCCARCWPILLLLQHSYY